MKDLALIWITRKSELEDQYLRQALINTNSLDVQRIIVGHTDIEPVGFEYIPFYEHGLDNLGLICHKKNIGVLASRSRVTMVMHADIIPSQNILKECAEINFKSEEFYAPVAFTGSGIRALTWCRYAGQHKPIDDPECNQTYISGGVIISLTENFRKYRWDQNLRHNQEEDWEFSKIIRAAGCKQQCAPEIRLLAANTQ